MSHATVSPAVMVITRAGNLSRNFWKNKGAPDSGRPGAPALVVGVLAKGTKWILYRNSQSHSQCQQHLSSSSTRIGASLFEHTGFSGITQTFGLSCHVLFEIHMASVQLHGHQDPPGCILRRKKRDGTFHRGMNSTYTDVDLNWFSKIRNRHWPISGIALPLAKGSMS